MKKKKGAKESISKKIDRVLKEQKKLMEEELNIEKKEDLGEKKELNELAKLEKIEKEVEKELKQHPLTKVTIRDVTQGSLGAFIAIILHYTVYYGVKIAEEITLTRATIIFFLSFFVGMTFLYITGFRKVNEGKITMFLPLRATVLYIVSIIVSLGVLFLFFPTFGASFDDVYKQTATVSLIAVIGACTADVIGK